MRTRAQQLTGRPVKIVVIQEAGLDGFWVHRLLEANGIESHVVDPASIAVPRRRRRAKTDAIDGETLLRTLLAWKRGEPRVCAMVVPPTPEEEDRRRICRERAILLRERIRHTNRIKGLLAGQGIAGFNPLHKDRRQLLDAAHTGDGRPLPNQLKAEILREIELIELLVRQIADVETERELLVGPKASNTPSPVIVLEKLKGIGPEIASVLYLEGLFRSFGNRRQLAAYAGLAPTPWRSGTVDQEQGISKAGNPRLRSTMIELAWLWQRHQPASTLSRWFHTRRRQRTRPDLPDLDRRPRSQAADCGLALCNRRRGPGGRRVEGRIARVAIRNIITASARRTPRRILVDGPRNVLAARCRHKDWSHLPEPCLEYEGFW
jgi:transposase